MQNEQLVKRALDTPTHTTTFSMCVCVLSVCVGMSASRLALLRCFNFNSSNNNNSKQQHERQTNKRRRICYHKRETPREIERESVRNRRGGHGSDSVCMWKFHVVQRFIGYRPTLIHVFTTLPQRKYLWQFAYCNSNTNLKQQLKRLSGVSTIFNIAICCCECLCKCCDDSR